jgi:hypothetical protein
MGEKRDTKFVMISKSSEKINTKMVMTNKNIQSIEKRNKKD